MGIAAESLETLLADINGGRAAQALPELDQLLTRLPAHPGLLTLRAEALRLTGRLDAAVEAFKQAAQTAGVAVAVIGKIVEGASSPRFLDQQGKEIALPRLSYSHF